MRGLYASYCPESLRLRILDMLSLIKNNAMEHASGTHERKPLQDIGIIHWLSFICLNLHILVEFGGLTTKLVVRCEDYVIFLEVFVGFVLRRGIMGIQDRKLVSSLFDLGLRFPLPLFDQRYRSDNESRLENTVSENL